MRIASILRHRLSIKILVIVVLLTAGFMRHLRQEQFLLYGVRKWGVLSGALRRAAPQQCFAACLMMEPLCAGGTAC